jgi:hypothetical protein
MRWCLVSRRERVRFPCLILLCISGLAIVLLDLREGPGGLGGRMWACYIGLLLAFAAYVIWMLASSHVHKNSDSHCNGGADALSKGSGPLDEPRGGGG